MFPIGLLIDLLIICVVIALGWWILTQIPLPPPMNWLARVVFGLILLIVLLSMLGGYGGPHALFYR